MISVIYSTHLSEVENNAFKSHIVNTIGVKDFQILEYQNNNQFSLAEIYNRGINESIYDIIVCMHNDVKLEKNWGKKILTDFADNPDYAIIGKAGTCYFPESGIYWDKMNTTMVGQVYHEPKNQKKWLNSYSSKLPFVIPVVSIDGLFIAFNKLKIKHKFDESYGKFHFYDHGFCLPNFLDGVKIGVTSSFEIIHQSVGMPNHEFFSTKEEFLKRYQKFLPIDLKPPKIFVPDIKEKLLKNIGEVAIIIPTKNNTELLIQCLESIIEKTQQVDYDIYVADTGSDEKEKLEISNFIKNTKQKIYFLEYNFYNFSKINNDVVKNRLEKNYEYLVFCNNDIKLLNNVLYIMLDTYKKQNNVGTVGARLHFADNTVQHDGIVAFFDKEKHFQVSHFGFKSYYKFSTSMKKIFGNTAALLMIKKKIFEKMGYFNENYQSCFEDVELNIKCSMSGLENFLRGDAVAYHYESQTRKKESELLEKINEDFRKNLKPFVMKNFDKLNSKILFN